MLQYTGGKERRITVAKFQEKHHRLIKMRSEWISKIENLYQKLNKEREYLTKLNLLKHQFTETDTPP